MPITELLDEEDVRWRLNTFFPDIAASRVDKYAQLLMLLRDEKRFRAGLEAISEQIWIAYNDPSNIRAPNRFTRSIVRVAARNFGFTCQENVVLTAPADSKAFGERIKHRVLWKDSFAAGHGEFAHSYQWLVAGEVLNWGAETAAIYQDTAGVRSQVPLFMKDTGGLTFRTAQLWEFLVDCTLYKPEFDRGVENAIDKWFEGQLNKWAEGQPTSSWFVDVFFRDADYKTNDPAVDLFRKVGFYKKSDYQSKWVGRRGTADAKRDVLANSDVVGFKKLMKMLYGRRNALTQATYRSANNVTTLSRDSKGWFISIYDNHRHMTLLRKQNERIELELKKTFAGTPERPLTLPALPDSSNPNYYKELSAKTLVKALPSAGELDTFKKKDGYVRGKLQPIEMRKVERKAHYDEKANFHASTDDPSIFHKKILPGERVMKGLVDAKFHGRRGLVNFDLEKLIDAKFHGTEGTVNIASNESQLLK